MKLLVPVTGGIVLLDQVTKALIQKWMPLHSVREVVPGFFSLVHVRNTGAAFSFLAGAPSSLRLAFLVTLTLLVMGILLFAYRKLPSRDRWMRAAYSLILGGAAGNLADRLRLGEVIDFWISMWAPTIGRRSTLPTAPSRPGPSWYWYRFSPESNAPDPSSHRARRGLPAALWVPSAQSRLLLELHHGIHRHHFFGLPVPYLLLNDQAVVEIWVTTPFLSPTGVPTSTIYPLPAHPR